MREHKDEPCNIVLDTNVLIKGFLEGNADCNSIIYSFYTNKLNILVFDITNTQIIKEYRSNLSDSELYQKWYAALAQGNKFFYTNGTLSIKIKSDLLKLGFHEASDHCFVASAYETDKVLISEDSDYGKGKEEKAKDKIEVLRYMTEQIGMRIMDYNEGRDFCC